MEKKNFRDFIKDESVLNKAGAIGMKMPKTKKEVDVVLEKISKLAKEAGASGAVEQLGNVRAALIRKIEIEQDNEFLKEIFHAASAMHMAIMDNGPDNFTASGLAHMLTTTLGAMEEKGMIKININNKLK